MLSGVGSFRADPLRLNTGNAGGPRPQVKQPPAENLFKSNGGPNEFLDVNSLFGSIFPPEDRLKVNPFERVNSDNAGSSGGNGHRDVARSYVSNYFQTNPAGKQVKVRPPEPPLFGTYE